MPLTYKFDTRFSSRFLLGIILPTSLAVILLIFLFYVVIIPAFEKSFVDSERSMIRELANVAWSVMALYEEKEQDGLLTQKEAQQMALSKIERLRYGDTNQNYFWVCDLQPTMVMHPYSKEMIGTDLGRYVDSDGKNIFLEFIQIASGKNEGFLNHTWHTKYSDQKVVSKLSYVKRFEPWGWIVGTGVFLDDVQRKTQEISKRLSIFALAAAVVFSVLLFYMSRQNLAIERKRRETEEELKQSKEKYKTLVESAAEPIMMILDGKCIYSNASMGQLLGYSAEELEIQNLMELFTSNYIDDVSRTEDVKPFIEGKKDSGQVEVQMLGKSGSQIHTRLTFITKSFGDENILLMTVRDMSRQERIKKQLGESQERYKLLASRLHIGIFRTTPEKNLCLLEANSETLRIFNLSGNDLMRVRLIDYLQDIDEPTDLMDALTKDGIVKDKIFALKKGKDEAGIVSLSLVLTRDEKGNPLYCEGIVEDITSENRRALEREKLIVDLQTSAMFLNQPLKNILSDCVDCDLHTPVREVAKNMVRTGRNSMLIRSESGTHIGIVTDMVLRERVVAENMSLETPVYEVMSSPVITVEENAMIFEAVLVMIEKGIKHLGVKNAKGRIVSVISNEELLEAQRLSTTFLINEINEATDVKEIAASHARLPGITKALTDSGVHAKHITRIITSISEAVFDKLMSFALSECGDPPVNFAFVSMGSEGRGEQTLATDQDNAIIFEDVPEDQLKDVSGYFSRLSTSICTALDQTGYDFCKGNFMAMNPKWCQPLSVWKSYFTGWVTEADPQGLMETGIFFDFNCSYGDSSFVKEIRHHIQKVVKRRPVFFHLMAENTLSFKIPLDFFGNISVESEGVHANSFNIKHILAMIVGFARIHAIQCDLQSTNTLQRLELVHEQGVLTTSAHQEVVESYNYLMKIRLRHQVKKINMGEKPDNFVALSELTRMEKDMLKKIFAGIGTLRKRLSGMGQGDFSF